MKIYSILQNIRPDVDFTKSEDFVKDGLLDSFDIVSLISEVESEFDIFIDGLEIVPENFTNIQKIEKLIIASGGKL